MKSSRLNTPFIPENYASIIRNYILSQTEKYDRYSVLTAIINKYDTFCHRELMNSVDSVIEGLFEQKKIQQADIDNYITLPEYIIHNKSDSIHYYRKLPVEIEAVQFLNTEESIRTIKKFLSSEIQIGIMHGKHYFSISTAEGIMTAMEGDFIIKGINGEFYPCKSDIFEKTYKCIS